jgi:hypothetical protein
MQGFEPGLAQYTSCCGLLCKTSFLVLKSVHTNPLYLLKARAGGSRKMRLAPKTWCLWWSWSKHLVTLSPSSDDHLGHPSHTAGFLCSPELCAHRAACCEECRLGFMPCCQLTFSVVTSLTFKGPHIFNMYSVSVRRANRGSEWAEDGPGHHSALSWVIP